MIFSLIQDFADALAAMPREHPRCRILAFLAEAIRRDVHFIDRHPTTFFQCMWNTCWWYDCPETQQHYDPSAREPNEPEHEGERLSALMEFWRVARDVAIPGFCWLRSLRPPRFALHSGRLAVLKGHDGFVDSIAYSPDGKYLLTGSEDSSIRGWDVQTGVELFRLQGKSNSVRSVAFGPAGQSFAAGSTDRIARLWTWTGPSLVHRFKGHDFWVSSLVFHPDGKRLITGVGRFIRFWDIASGQMLECREGTSAFSVACLAISHDGRHLAIACADRSIRIWQVDSLAEVRQIQGHTDTIRQVAFSDDDQSIASASHDQTVRIWEVATGAELHCFRGHENWVMCVAFVPEHNWVVSGSADFTLRLWDLENGIMLHCFRGHDGWVHCLAVSPDGQRIASGSGDRTICLWDTENRDRQRRLAAPKAWILWMHLEAEGRLIVTGSEDRTIHVWDAHNGLLIASFHGDRNTLARLQVSEDGTRIAITMKDGDLMELTPVKALAVADTPPSSTLYAEKLKDQVIIRRSEDAEPLAWFPVPMNEVIPLHSGRAWVGRTWNQLCVFALEGEST